MADKPKEKRKLKERTCVFLIFVIIMVIRSFFSFRISSLVQITGADEFGTIAGAAFFGGRDWSNIVSANCPYYGFGFSALLCWMFKVTSNPVILHWLMTFANTILLCCVGAIAYIIMRYHFDIKDNRICIAAALSAALFFNSLVYANLVINETMLVFIIWLVLLIMLEIRKEENKFKKFWLNVSLAIVCSYSLMVHTRSIIIICAVVVTGIMMFVYGRKTIINFFVFIPTLVIGYLISTRIVDMVQTVLWKAGEDSVLVNSTGSVFESLSYIRRLFEPGGPRGFVYAVTGQLYTLFTLSGGFIAIGFIACIVILFNGFAIGRKNSGRKKKADRNKAFKEYTPYAISAAFVFSALLATLILNVSSALRLTPDIVLGNAASGSQKWFVYVRYNALFCSPLIMLVFGYIYKYRENAKKAINIAAGLFALAGAGFFAFVVKYLIGVSTNLSGEFYFLFPLSHLRRGDLIDIRCFITMSTVAVIVFAVIFFSIKFNNEWIGAIVFVILNVYIFGFISVNIHEANALQTRSYSDRYEYVIGRLEKIRELPQIYINRKNTGAMYAYSCQYALNKYPIIEGMPEEGANEAVVLSMHEADELFDMSQYTRYDLTEIQHIYIRGDDLKVALEHVISEKQEKNR
ncbi:MAG: hypothetical protein IJM37_12080 [Lachnospiraceae bacterium]|nr:hypothetical protein [Lachnospiraceae bacterium]